MGMGLDLTNKGYYMRKQSIPEDMLKGTIHKTNNCGDCYIVEYITSKEVIVGFPGYEHTTTVHAGSVRKGLVKNVMLPSVCNIGYLGLGEYSRLTHKKVYRTWLNMLRRCYSAKCQEVYPTYIGCSVVDAWHNFQNFAKWYCQHLWEEDEVPFLDKDIIKQGNKVYSPEYCALVTREVNIAVVNPKAARGKYKLGVYWEEERKKFKASYSDSTGKIINLGRYSCETEAHEAYKNAKYKLLKELAAGQKDERVKKGLTEWVIPEY